MRPPARVRRLLVLLVVGLATRGAAGPPDDLTGLPPPVAFTPAVPTVAELQSHLRTHPEAAPDLRAAATEALVVVDDDDELLSVANPDAPLFVAGGKLQDRVENAFDPAGLKIVCQDKEFERQGGRGAPLHLLTRLRYVVTGPGAALAAFQRQFNSESDVLVLRCENARIDVVARLTSGSDALGSWIRPGGTHPTVAQALAKVEEITDGLFELQRRSASDDAGQLATLRWFPEATETGERESERHPLLMIGLKIDAQVPGWPDRFSVGGRPITDKTY